MERAEFTREDVEQLTYKLHRERLIHSCMTCMHFKETDLSQPPFHDPKVSDQYPAEHCLLYKIRPPARVIAYGCPSWEEDLPF